MGGNGVWGGSVFAAVFSVNGSVFYVVHKFCFVLIFIVALLRNYAIYYPYEYERIEGKGTGNEGIGESGAFENYRGAAA